MSTIMVKDREYRIVSFLDATFDVTEEEEEACALLLHGPQPPEGKAQEYRVVRIRPGSLRRNEP